MCWNVFQFWSPWPVPRQQEFGGSEAVVAEGVGPIIGGRVVTQGPELSEAFDAVY